MDNTAAFKSLLYWRLIVDGEEIMGLNVCVCVCVCVCVRILDDSVAVIIMMMIHSPTRTHSHAHSHTLKLAPQVMDYISGGIEDVAGKQGNRYVRNK